MLELFHRAGIPDVRHHGHKGMADEPNYQRSPRRTPTTTAAAAAATATTTKLGSRQRASRRFSRKKKHKTKDRQEEKRSRTKTDKTREGPFTCERGDRETTLLLLVVAVTPARYTCGIVCGGKKCLALNSAKGKDDTRDSGDRWAGLLPVLLTVISVRPRHRSACCLFATTSKSWSRLGCGRRRCCIKAAARVAAAAAAAAAVASALLAAAALY